MSYRVANHEDRFSRDEAQMISILRPKKNTCVSANMPKKIRVGRSENLFIFCLIFVC